MSCNRFLWPLIAVATTAGGFFSVRVVWPGTAGDAIPGNLASSLPPASRSSAEIDAALNRAGKDGDVLARRLIFLEMIGKAGPAELRQMFLSGQSTRREKRSIAQRWAETDAPGLCAFLRGMSRTEWELDAEQNDIVSGILFRTWALEDPDAALEAAGALGNRPQFRSAQWSIVATLFGKDPAKGFALAAKLPNTNNSGQDRLVDTVWKNDPAAFLKSAGEAPLAALKNWRVNEAVDNAFADLAKKDSAAAAAWLKARPVDQQKRVWGRMAFRFAEVDPAAATAWFKDMPPSAGREAAGAEIVHGWATKDPHAALEWLQDNLQGGRTEAFAHLAGALAEIGIDSAKQLFDAMPPGAQRDGVVSAIANKWAEKDIKPAIAWVLSLPPDDPGRRHAVEQIGYQWADKDLAGAAAYVRDNPDSQETSPMFSQVAYNFANKDPGGGIAWAATLPEAYQKQAQMSLFYNALSRKKLPEVFAAVEKLPAAQQQATVGHIAAIVLESTTGDAVYDARYLNSLKQVPASLRGVARSVIEKSESGSPERKEAALKALK